MLTSAERALGGVPASPGNMAVGLAVEALRKPSGPVEDLTCVDLEIFQQPFIDEVVGHCDAVGVDVQRGITFSFC